MAVVTVLPFTVNFIPAVWEASCVDHVTEYKHILKLILIFNIRTVFVKPNQKNFSYGSQL